MISVFRLVPRNCVLNNLPECWIWQRHLVEKWWRDRRRVLKKAGGVSRSCWNCLRSSVGFEVIAAVVMKKSIFWDKTPFSFFKVNPHIGATFCLHLHFRSASQVRDQDGTGGKQGNTALYSRRYNSYLGSFSLIKHIDLFLWNLRKLFQCWNRKVRKILSKFRRHRTLLGCTSFVYLLDFSALCPSLYRFHEFIWIKYLWLNVSHYFIQFLINEWFYRVQFH